MKKIVGFCLAMVLIFSISSVAFADIVLVNEQTVKGGSSYSSEVWDLKKSNGKKLNVYVKNNAKSGTVTVEVFYKDTKIGSAKIAPNGDHDTVKVPVDKNGKYKFKIKRSSTGDPLNVFVHARQY